MYAKGSASSRYGDDAMTPSFAPKLGSSGETGSIQIPKPRRTGNQITDEDATPVHICFEEMVSGLHNKRQHVMPMYLQYQKRLKHEHEEEEEEEGQARGGELFDKAFTTLRVMEEDWFMNWVAGNSNRTLMVNMLIKAKRVDLDSICQLASYALQLPLSIKMPDVMRVKDIAYRAFHARAKAVGGRLAVLRKKQGSFMANGQIKWALGCYSFVKEGNLFTEVHHYSGDSADISKENLSDEYALENNWPDWEAQLKRGRFPGIKLSLFFEGTDKGPCKWPQVTNKCKDLGMHCERVASAWQDERAKLNLGNQTDMIAKRELANMKAEQNENNLAKAGAQAKSLLNERKKVRTVRLAEKTSTAASSRTG